MKEEENQKSKPLIPRELIISEGKLFLNRMVFNSTEELFAYLEKGKLPASCNPCDDTIQ